MKRTFILITLTMLLSMVVGTAFANTKSIDGVIYYWTGNKPSSLSVQGFDDNIGTAVTIPEKVQWGNNANKTAEVTKILDGAFISCTRMTSITISKNVTSIGASAFNGCTGLTSVTFSADAGLTSIGANAFEGCNSITSISIPANVTSIGAGAFSGCSSLTSISIPASVTSIGEGAFSGCSGLTTMTVDPNNTTYSSPTNSNCIIFSSTLIAGCHATIIPSSVTSIGAKAFRYITSLTSITIPSNITSIGASAFEGCKNNSFTSITIPNSVTSIGDKAFKDCTKLTSVISLSANPPSLSSNSEVFSNISSNCILIIPYGCQNAYSSWASFFGGGIKEDISTLTIADIPAQIYTGSELTPQISLKNGNTQVNLTSGTDYTVEYEDNVNVGAAKVTVTGTGNYIGTIPTATFTITPAASSVTSAPSAKTGLVYSGDPQELVNGGSTDDGMLVYSLDGVAYSASIPTGTNAGDYTVYYKVVGDANHNDYVASAPVNVTISKASIDDLSVNITGWTYGEEANRPTVTGYSGEDVTYQYKVKDADDSTYSETVPNDAGEYTVRATVAETDNYLGATATADFTIAKKSLTVTASAQTITYGGSISTGTDNVTVSGLVDGDELSEVTLTAGEGVITPSAAVIKKDGTDVTSNYNITYATGTLTVNAKSVTITASAQTITYGGSISTGTDNVTVSGLVDGDELSDVTLTAGDGVITPSAAVIKKDGTDVTSNYNITYATGTLTVNAKSVTVTASAQTITYGGSISTGTDNVTVSGLVDGDELSDVTLTAGEGVITPSSAVIMSGGTDVTSNYNITYATGTLTVNAKSVTVTGITAENKVYDGTVTATLVYTGVEFAGKEEGDDLSVTAIGAFADAGAGVKTVNITNLTLGGTSASNYVLATTGQQTSATATISKKSVTVTGIAAEDKVYDGTVTATLVYTNVTLTGKLADDDLSVTATGAFADAGVGVKTVNITDLELGGTSAANYVLAAEGQQTSASASITAAEITVSGITAANKTYDGTVDATLVYTGVTFSGKLADDVLTVTAAGAFADAGAGENKTVNITDLELGGEAAPNYTLASEGQQATTTASITAAEITVSGITAENKVYDGTVDATLVYTGVTFSGKLADDVLTVTATGAFADAGAGENKTVNITDLTLGGTSASNYTLASEGQQATTTADITAAEITISGITASDKPYDGTVDATLVYTGVTFSGKLADDVLTVTATGAFADAGAGENKTVNITDLTLGGTSAGNYVLAATGQQTTATASISYYNASLIDDGDDNATVISTIVNNYGGMANVTLSGRTFFKDGHWNTICLPFDVTIADSPLAGADVRELNSAAFSNGTLTLEFTEVTEIKAGVPYIVKWTETGDPIVEAVFEGVTLSNSAPSEIVVDLGDEKSVTFKGLYAPIAYTATDKSALLVGEGSTLYYPLEGAYVNAQHAYFQLTGIEVGDVESNAIGLRFGDATGIYDLKNLNVLDANYYDLSGRRLEGRPTETGIYIVNGKKVVVK